MKNYKKHIDDLIREKAGRGAETPPSHIWEQLDKQLDGLAPSKPVASYRWLRYGAIASLALLLSVIVVKKIDSSLRPETNNTAGANTNAQNTLAQQATPSTGATATAQGSPAVTAQNTNSNDNTIATANNSSSNNNNNSNSNNNNSNSSNTPTAATTANNTGNSANKPTTTANPNNTGKNEKKAYTNKGNDKNITPKTKLKQGDTIAANDGAANRKRHGQPRHTTPQPTEDHNYGSNPDNINNNTNTLPGNTTTAANTQAATTPGATANNTAAATGNQNTTTPGDPNNIAATAQPAKGPLAANKPNPPQPATNPKPVVKKPAVKKHKPMSQPATRWETGIKAGYESGFNSYAASKAAVSPYVQYNISGKVSVLVQPTAKYAQLTAHSVGNDQSYYQVNDDGSVAQTGPTVQQGSNYITNYTYNGTHDSIIKSYAARGSYMEFELPILLKYYLAKKVSVFGGINLMYSILPGIAQNTYTQSGIAKTVDFNTVTPYVPTALPAAPDVAYSGTPYANYNGPLYQPSATGKFHIGYMIGAGYEVGKKWLFDALIEQSPVAPNVVGGYNVNAPLSQMYFRLSAGYKFKKSHKVNVFGGKDTGRGD